MLLAFKRVEHLNKKKNYGVHGLGGLMGGGGEGSVPGQIFKIFRILPFLDLILTVTSSFY
jgi:hypothetical protein